MLDVAAAFEKAKLHTEAMRHYLLAVDEGDVEACARVGSMFAKGKGVAKDAAEAVRWYERGAAAGSARAKMQLGSAYLRGAGVDADPALALKLYEEAAAAGDPWAMCNLGSVFNSGAHVSRDCKAATEWYKRAAKAGDSLAMANLSEIYANGRDGVQADPATSFAWARAAATNGDGSGRGFACRRLGLAFERGIGTSKDHLEAAKWYRLGVAEEDGWCMHNLASMLETGVALAKDEAAAERLFEQAAVCDIPACRISATARLGRLLASRRHQVEAQKRGRDLLALAVEGGSGGALIDLARLYLHGIGGVPDYAEAKRLFEQGAAAQDAVALAYLGDLYRDGKGCARAPDVAIVWYGRASTAGLSSASYAIGRMYYKGNGVTQSHGAALRWFHKAVDQGSAAAMWSVARMHELGEGTRRSIDRARSWYVRAQEAGDPDAPDDLARLGR
jgi:TPR repeat protein